MSNTLPRWASQADALECDTTIAPARIHRGELKLATNARAKLEDFKAVLPLPPADVDASREAERVALTRKTATAAVRANCMDAVRRLLAEFCTCTPEELAARMELAALRDRADAQCQALLKEQVEQRLGGTRATADTSRN